MPASEPKTRPTGASVAEFIAAVPDAARQADCNALIKLMQRATGNKPVMWGAGIVGFGSYGVRYANGSVMDWPLVGFSPRKNDLTLYLMHGFAEQADLLARLGRHKTGKSCLYLKRLSDADPAVLAELIDRSVAALADRRTS
jgi:Domain of unknown function (DU1801)